jgi:hypothetical protein
LRLLIHKNQPLYCPSGYSLEGCRTEIKVLSRIRLSFSVYGRHTPQGTYPAPTASALF